MLIKKRFIAALAVLSGSILNASAAAPFNSARIKSVPPNASVRLPVPVPASGLIRPALAPIPNLLWGNNASVRLPVPVPASGLIRPALAPIPNLLWGNNARPAQSTLRQGPSAKEILLHAARGSEKTDVAAISNEVFDGAAKAAAAEETPKVRVFNGFLPKSIKETADGLISLSGLGQSRYITVIVLYWPQFQTFSFYDEGNFPIKQPGIVLTLLELAPLRQALEKDGKDYPNYPRRELYEKMIQGIDAARALIQEKTSPELFAKAETAEASTVLNVVVKMRQGSDLKKSADTLTTLNISFKPIRIDEKLGFVSIDEISPSYLAAVASVGGPDIELIEENLPSMKINTVRPETRGADAEIVARFMTRMAELTGADSNDGNADKWGELVGETGRIIEKIKKGEPVQRQEFEMAATFIQMSAANFSAPYVTAFISESVDTAIELGKIDAKDKEKVTAELLQSATEARHVIEEWDKILNQQTPK